jgi:flagellar basal-body rod modification protein FlgD
MNISSIRADSIPQTQATSLLPGDSADDVTQTFLTLLMTELKAQDPTSPMDPTQMVGQMVQMNTLGEIMKIRELVQAIPAVNPTMTGTTTNATTGGN